MPKSYEQCKQTELAKGKSLKEAKKMCAISYYKKTGHTPMQDEKKASIEAFDPDEIELFATIETIGEVLYKRELAELSLDQQSSAVRTAFYDQFDKDRKSSLYVVSDGVYDDYLICQEGIEYYVVQYEESLEGGYNFMPKADWITVVQIWMPVRASERREFFRKFAEKVLKSDK